MLAFVGSQLGNDDEKGGPEVGRAGIGVRLYSQRLWTIAVIIEHCVFVGRISKTPTRGLRTCRCVHPCQNVHSRAISLAAMQRCVV